MISFKSSISFIAGTVIGVLLIGGGSVAYAANGGSLLIGRSNFGSATTTLTNSAGTALKLNSKAGTAPLAVNSGTKVTNLNADKVDGVTEGSLARAAAKTGVIMGSIDDADGFEDTAKCPAGTVATGGGGYAANSDFDALWYSGPDYDVDTGNFIANSWYAGGTEGFATAFVICMNMRGAVAGADTGFGFAAAARGAAPDALVQRKAASRK